MCKAAITKKAGTGSCYVLQCTSSPKKKQHTREKQLLTFVRIENAKRMLTSNLV